jgi:hypothetical protein
MMLPQVSKKIQVKLISPKPLVVASEAAMTEEEQSGTGKTSTVFDCF